MIHQHLLDQLELHEGFRSKPYRDSVGKLTIGIGRNLDDVGITRKEALFLLEQDIIKVQNVLEEHWWYNQLSQVRKDVVTDMAFNLGVAGFFKFKRTIGSISRGEYGKAAAEMLESKWARQVGSRARRLAEMMRKDTYID